MQNKEVWKPIEGFEGYYEISNNGKVKRLDNYVKHSRSGTCLRKGGLLNSAKTPQGYLFVGLSKLGKIKRMTIHKLVALHFVDGYFEGAVINHKDGNKENNFYLNLEWCSQKQNVQHGIDIGLNNNYGKGHYNAYLILDLYTGIFYDTLTEAARHNSIKKSTLIWRILHNKSKRFIRV